MSTKKYDLAVFIGRMQLPHVAHLENIKKALEIAEHVVVAIGSANSPRTIKNPWKWTERKLMLSSCFNAEDSKRITYVPIEDRLYNNQQWCYLVQEQVERAVEHWEVNPKNIALVGHHKDESSFYLDMFPQWDLVETGEFGDFNSTVLRDSFFTDKEQFFKEVGNIVPSNVLPIIEAFADTETYDLLVEEYNFIQSYKDKWAAAPYPPTFNASDAVVFQSGHILLIRRRSAPGKGLWAIPGGYINQDETSLQAAMRELREETKLKVPEPVLEGSLISSKVFDHPSRSLRGRIFSHAFAFELKKLGPLPKVKGSDDADKARWFTFDEVLNMRDQLFEDHADIINHFMWMV